MPERRDLGDAGLRDGWIVGLAQVLALAPGTSRSGITITAARWLGLDRDSAARFSFLLLIPAVAGAPPYKTASARHQGLPPRPLLLPAADPGGRRRHPLQSRQRRSRRAAARRRRTDVRRDGCRRRLRL